MTRYDEAYEYARVHPFVNPADSIRFAGFVLGYDQATYERQPLRQYLGTPDEPLDRLWSDFQELMKS